MKTIVISLGGSIIVPDKPDYFFIREFKNFVLNQLSDYKVIIVCGGGKTNSYYNNCATRVSNISKEDLDWIGIMASRLNAELIRTVFGELAYEKVIINPNANIKTKKNIIIGAGWKPGRSSDYVAVLLAKNNKADEIINLTNIEYVYDKDPNEFKDAKKLFNVSWSAYRKIVGNTWSPRLSTPFDPIASKLCEKEKLKVAILKGNNLVNLKNYLLGKDFVGTIIE